tara:strand:- start:380 stop:547 length:168 start_codon:yes stop_codon:yes gene_type:complete
MRESKTQDIVMLVALYRSLNDIDRQRMFNAVKHLHRQQQKPLDVRQRYLDMSSGH